MASYTGTNAEGARARTLAHERENQQAEFKRKQEEIKKANTVKLLDMNDAFQSRQSQAEDLFKAQTVGLVSASDFRAKRLEVEELERERREKEQKGREKERKRKGKEREEKKKALTFDMEEDEVAVAAGIATGGEAEEKKELSAATSSSSTAAAMSSDAAASAAPSSSAAEDQPSSKRQKIASSTPAVASLEDLSKIVSSGKDPLADTSFLPDRAREAAEAALRARLAAEWLQTQEKAKSEQIEIVYSYWDGTGHRNRLVCTKGLTIGGFLEKCRKDLVTRFPELRGLGADSLMYIKEDLIIPQHLTFWDFITTKARGKSGPLFNFDVHDDVRLMGDASIEKDESHAGKIVTKGWYDRNKLNFPASRWEMYDPLVIRDKYTIKGGEVRGAHAK